MIHKLHKCPSSLNEFERVGQKLNFYAWAQMGSLVLSLIGLYPMTHNIKNGHLILFYHINP